MHFIYHGIKQCPWFSNLNKFIHVENCCLCECQQAWMKEANVYLAAGQKLNFWTLHFLNGEIPFGRTLPNKVSIRITSFKFEEYSQKYLVSCLNQNDTGWENYTGWNIKIIMYFCQPQHALLASITTVDSKEKISPNL